MASVTVRVPGKINLSLRAGPRRADGYHPLVTVFQAVGVWDELTAEEADEVSVRFTRPNGLPADSRNLAVKAANLLAGRCFPAGGPGARLTIDKRIPIAGGMAGGSADAAAALAACDKLWGCGLTQEELLGLAAELGADVPFCLLGGTALGVNRGDKLRPVRSHGEYHWALALAHQGMSTPEVFRRFDELPAVPFVKEAPDELLQALASADARRVGKELRNDLAAAAVSLRPELGELLSLADGLGAHGAVISGSGPTVAFLLPGADAAREAALRLGNAPGVARALAVSGPVSGPLGG
ncbi:MAG: 4-(cytidine 5'-diphospho)-2-C-methyl-D-erythritol kinase [Propionibacteriaceae bacterium]|jgi:4-diphosphocytidyl-2-C-methyl-D-erythritol kinase|nr:4-(cytidine 5'-diphospho)-2-C-methyl-D-erythritol kinase [Propionibacteriaceae bacterium]